MAVVFAILKVMGILLLILLGLLVFLCAAVLFVPVRYSFKFTVDGTVTFGFSASWFLHAVRLRKGVTEPDIHLYVFGIDTGRMKRKGKNKARTKAEEGKGNGRVEVTSDYDSGTPEERESGKEGKTVHTEPSGKQGETVRTEPSGTKRAAGKKKAKRHSGKKVSARGKKSFSFDTISSIITLIRGSEHKAGIQKLKKELSGLFYYLKPSQVKGSVIFGTGDPCTTGWILGIISLIPIAYTEGLRVIPDFGEKELDADIFAKGKVHVLYFLRMIVRGYRDKDMKAVLTKALEYV